MFSNKYIIKQIVYNCYMITNNPFNDEFCREKFCNLSYYFITNRFRERMRKNFNIAFCKKKKKNKCYLEALAKIYFRK